MIVTVDTLDDSIGEPVENFEGVLSSPNGNGLPFSLGSDDTATVEITDNDCEKIKTIKLYI